MEAVNKIRDTASSHERVYVVAAWAGILAISPIFWVAGGADVIIIPEVPYDVEKVCEHIKHANQQVRRITLSW